MGKTIMTVDDSAGVGQMASLTLRNEGFNEENGRKAAGATGWIVKPFKSQQLLAVVKKLIG